MNPLNRIAFSLYIIYLCSYSKCLSKGFLKPLENDKQSSKTTEVYLNNNGNSINIGTGINDKNIQSNASLIELHRVVNKAFLKNSENPINNNGNLNKSDDILDSAEVENDLDENEKTNGSYYSLNEISMVSDHLSHSNRKLAYLPNFISLAEITTDIDEAKEVTHHLVTNIYLEIKSYMNSPSGICIFVIILLITLIFVAKILLASSFLKRHHETPQGLDAFVSSNAGLKKSTNFSEDYSKNNYLSALQEEKSATFRTANSHLRKSSFSELKNPENHSNNYDNSVFNKKNMLKTKKTKSEKNFNSQLDQNENFQDFSQAFEEDVDILMKNIDLDDQITNVQHSNHIKPHEINRKIKEINILGQQIILNGNSQIKKERAYSENNDKDLYYDLDENYFSDCNLSEIPK